MRFEPPDLLVATFSGQVTLEEARWMVGVYQEVFAGGPFYVIADVSHSSLPAEPRKYLSSTVRAEWTRAIVYVGADMGQRIITKALSVGMLFAGKEAGFDTVFLDSVEAGRAWVAAHRARSGKQRTG
ncbi:STAS/SEC14 domain-containing protein [Corallococcus praedator]|uniref:STAS/SEC14 domain-containing protein n=2 Tax=Myxococcaceae TaxID=31 RepID=A0ABX9QPB4_9BACT|nr:STAS/SEC14 domain-containing protein [Corallococcus sp. CA047B]RKH35756.1 STAS/SEC14 domain-containing protein [Corallococcus sp. CA031C]RKI15402.1 STAS/SEC14 domain-containing protein [Corallococcus praedator]